MKSMKQMQEEMLKKCDNGKEWPKPYIHFGGVVQLIYSQEEWEKVDRLEMIMLPICVIAAIGFVYIITLFVN